MHGKDVIVLEKSLCFAKGANMEVYINPRDQKQCIKIQIGHLRDYCQEMTYRKSRQRRKFPRSVLMTEYFGTVETNLGTGYVFERVADYDGATSKTIHELLRLEMKAREKGVSIKELTGSEKEYPCVKDVLIRLHKLMFQEKMILDDEGLWNFNIQFETPADWQVRVVDGFGTRAKIHAMYYFDFLAIGHCRRFWRRLVNVFTNPRYSGFFTEQEIEEIKNLV